MTTGVWPQRQNVSFASGNGECVAWFSTPDTRGPHPCVVLGNGFSMTRHDGLDQFAAVFAAAGLAVLVFDYRYFGDSPGQPRQRFRRRKQVEDFGNAASWARSHPDVDAAKIALWGFSFGGAHALEVAMADPTIAAVTVLCPFVDGLRRLLATPPKLAAWIIPRALLDQAGRHTLIPVTSQPGGHGAMSLTGEADGFVSVAPEGSPWLNEISPAVFLSVGTYRPVTRAGQVLMPLWVGLGDRDITTDGDAVRRLAVDAPNGELHQYDADHFSVFATELGSQIAHDQVKFFRRTGLLPEEIAVETETMRPDAG